MGHRAVEERGGRWHEAAPVQGRFDQRLQPHPVPRREYTLFGDDNMRPDNGSGGFRARQKHAPASRDPARHQTRLVRRSAATAIGSWSNGARCLLVGFAVLLTTSPAAFTTPAAAFQSTSPIPGFAEDLDMIRDLLDRGRGIEAENVARALLARVERIKGPDVLEIAETLDLLGRAVRRSSRVTEQEKRELAERAVAIRKRLLRPADPDLATSLINLGVQRALAGDPAAARPLLERALAIREAAFGPDHTLVAGALQSLGGLLMTLHDDAGAMALLDRAQQIRETVYGAGHADTVRTLVNLAIFHQEVGDYTGARRRYERALALGEKIDGPADLSTLNVLTGAAIVLGELGADPAGAAILNERLLALIERSFGPA